MSRILPCIFTLVLGIGIGWVVRQPDARPLHGDRVVLMAGDDIRIIHPGKDGPESVPLRILRIEREANTSVIDPTHVWTLVVGDTHEPVWVYATP